MIIKGHNRYHDTDIIDDYLTRMNELNGMEQEEMKHFHRYAYWRYQRIRDELNTGCKCKALPLHTVETMLSHSNNVAQALSMSNDEINYIVKYIKDHVKLIR